MCLRPSYYQMAVTDSQRKTFGNHLHKIVARIVSITTSANGELCLICLFFNVCMQHDGKRVTEFSLKFHDRSKMIRRKFLWQIADHPLNLGFFFFNFEQPWQHRPMLLKLGVSKVCALGVLLVDHDKYVFME